MRMKQSRVQTCYLRRKQTKKDGECSTYEEYGEAFPISCEVWPAGGKVQAELYGEMLSYIRNVKVEGEYYITTDRNNTVHYVFPNGIDIMETDGICIYVPADCDPDYNILSVRPYNPLRLEARYNVRR